MIIESAERFDSSTTSLRGRVGRGADCAILYPYDKSQTMPTATRMEIDEE
jgi:RecG-like helicase